MMPRRIGVYGGTFNPPHMGHVRAAEAFLSAIQLDQLMIIPSFLPPHKTVDDGVSAADRLHMVHLAFSDMERTVVSDMEIVRGGRSYTSDTLSLLAREDVELYFLVGTDMFLSMDTWHEPETVFRLADICYIRRESDDETQRLLAEKARAYEARFGARIHRIDVEPLRLSSSEIRAGLAQAHALPAAVRHYIQERGLYRHDGIDEHA